MYQRLDKCSRARRPGRLIAKACGSRGAANPTTARLWRRREELGLPDAISASPDILPSPPRQKLNSLIINRRPRPVSSLAPAPQLRASLNRSISFGSRKQAQR